MTPDSDARGKTADTIRKLAEGLMYETDSREHRFRLGWVEQLLERYRKSPGSPTVHLSDFVQHSIIYLRPDARPVIKSFWNQLSPEQRHSVWNTQGSLARNMRSDALPTMRLKTWISFGNLTGFNVNCLEPHVDSIRLSDGPHIRMLNSPRLPVNLATPAGARLIGYYFDSNSRNSAFSNKNPALHEDYRRTVHEVFGDLTISETIMERGGFGKGHYIRTNVGYAVRNALTVAGLDCIQDQTQANNPLPSWMFNSGPSIKSGCLSAARDAEGSVNYHDLKLRQGAPVSLCTDEGVRHWPATKALRRLTRDNQARVEGSPSLLLVSAALLLYSMRIVSRLVPTHISLTRDGNTSHWQLRIQRKDSIRTFRAEISLMSEKKESALRFASSRRNR